MSLDNKNDTKILRLVFIALIGGILGGYLSNASINNSGLDSLSNAFTAQLDTKNTEIASLKGTVSDLENQMSVLENSVAELYTPTVVGFNTPDYDSGWRTIDADETLEVQHDLSSPNLLYMRRNDT